MCTGRLFACSHLSPLRLISQRLIFRTVTLLRMYTRVSIRLRRERCTVRGSSRCARYGNTAILFSDMMMHRASAGRSVGNHKARAYEITNYPGCFWNPISYFSACSQRRSNLGQDRYIKVYLVCIFKLYRKWSFISIQSLVNLFCTKDYMRFLRLFINNIECI